MGKASTRAHNKYISKAYDRVNLTLPKGQKDDVQAHAAARGESVNGFIGRAITEAMERDSGENASRIAENRPESAQGAGVALPSETLEAAQMAAGRTGESVAVFVARAVAEQGKRDDVSFKMGINPV